MGGGDVAGIGWACGVERLAMLMEENIALPRPIAVIPVGEDTQDKALQIAHQLRLAGFNVEQSYSGNMKKRLIKANKINAAYAVILGSDELASGSATLKNLDSGEQKNVSLDNLTEELK